MTVLRTPGEDALVDYGRIAAQAFNRPAQVWPMVRARHAGAMRVVLDGGAVVGGLTQYRFAQWFGGRPVPSGGVAAVCVDAARRGRGAGRALVLDTLREFAEDGLPIAALFPTTTAFYRTLGFERAGARLEYALDPHHIGRGDRPRALWPLGGDAQAVVADLATRSGLARAGNVVRCAPLWERLFEDRGGTPVHRYAIGRDGQVDGALVYQQVAPVGGGVGYDIRIRELIAVTPEALASAWAYLWDLRMLARAIRWHGPAADARTWALPEHGWTVADTQPWMLRVLDLPTAVSARGWSRDGAVSVEVSDPLFPAQSGRWQLEVAEGRGALTRGGAGEVVLTARALGPLFTGLLSATALAAAGLVQGTPAALARVDALVSGPEPWLQDYF